MVEYRRAVLGSDIRPLPIDLRRFMKGEEFLKQSRVAHSLWIKYNLDGFCMPGSVRAHILISWTLKMASNIADSGLEDSFHPVEFRLNTPEASCRESRFLCIHDP